MKIVADNLKLKLAGTYSQIYIQAVFPVKGRKNLLKKAWRDEAFKYIAGK